MYKLVAKNEKGEATSSTIDVIAPPTVEAPVIQQKLTDVVGAIFDFTNKLVLIREKRCEDV